MRAGAVALLGVVLAAALSCKQQVSSQDRLCTPGNYVFCRCKDLSEGTKLCHDDGMGFDPCTACQPDQEVPPSVDPGDADLPDTAEPDDGGAGDASAADVVTSAEKAGPGDLLITEVLYDPSGTEPDGEWIEIYNATSTARLLSGLTIKDGGNRTEAIPTSPPLVIAPGQYVVLARDTVAATAARVPSSAIVLEYGAGVAVSQGILLANSTGGAVWLLDGTTTITGMQYGGWFSQSSPGGKSIQLKTLSFAASGSQSSWCLSASSWASGTDKGTPGAASDCP